MHDTMGLVKTQVIMPLSLRLKRNWKWYPTFVSDLVKEIDYDAKISDIETKYFTSSNYDKYTGEILNTKMK